MSMMLDVHAVQSITIHTHNNHALYTFVCVCVPHGVIMKAVEDPYQAK